MPSPLWTLIFTVLIACFVCQLGGCRKNYALSLGEKGAGSIGRAEQATMDAEFVNGQLHAMGDKTEKKLSEAITHHHGETMMALADTRTYSEQLYAAFNKLNAKYNGFVAARIGWKNWRDFWILTGIWAGVGVLSIFLGVGGFIGTSKAIMQILPGSNLFVWLRNRLTGTGAPSI